MNYLTKGTLVRAAATALLIAGSLMSPATGHAEAPVAAFHRFLGWTFGDGKVRSIYYSGSNGEFISSNVISRDGNLRIYKSKQANIDIVDGYGKFGQWLRDENGFVSYGDVESNRARASEDALVSGEFATLPVRLIGSDIIVDVPNGWPVHLRFDEHSGALLEALIVGTTRTRKFVALSYAEVAPGIRVLAEWRVDDWRSPEKPTIEINTRTAKLASEKQVSRAAWKIGAARTFPFSAQGGRVKLPFEVNGVRGYCVLDTGSLGTVLSSDFAARAKVIGLFPRVVNTIDSTRALLVARARNVTVGNAAFSNAVVYVSTQDFDGADALCGFDLLAGVTLSLNFNSHTFTIVGNKLERRIEGAVLPLNFSNGVPLIDVTAQGVTLRAFIDTGYEGPVQIDLVSRVPLRPVIGNDHKIVVTRNDDLSCLYSVTLDLGKDLAPEVAPACYNLRAKTWPMVIGASEIFRHNKITFDYLDARIYVE